MDWSSAISRDIAATVKVDSKYFCLRQADDVTETIPTERLLVQ